MRREIIDEKSLREVHGYLHDAIFKATNFKYAPHQRKFLMEIEREEKERQLIFFRKHKTMWQKCLLVFEDVVSYNVSELMGIKVL